MGKKKGKQEGGKIRLRSVLITLLIVVSVALIMYFMYLLFFEDIELGGKNESEQERPAIEEISGDLCAALGCPPGMVYVGSKNSDRYYPCDCHYAQSINPENIVCFDSDAGALAQHYIRSLC